MDRVEQVKLIRLKNAEKLAIEALHRANRSQQIAQDLIDNPPQKKCCKCCNNGRACSGKK